MSNAIKCLAIIALSLLGCIYYGSGGGWLIVMAIILVHDID